jgi:hypothetical protein
MNATHGVSDQASVRMGGIGGMAGIPHIGRIAGMGGMGGIDGIGFMGPPTDPRVNATTAPRPS